MTQLLCQFFCALRIMPLCAGRTARPTPMVAGCGAGEVDIQCEGSCPCYLVPGMIAAAAAILLISAVGWTLYRKYHNQDVETRTGLAGATDF